MDSFLLDELFAATNIKLPEISKYHDNHMLNQLVENNLAICPDLKFGMYGFSLENILKRDVVALPFKEKNLKQLSSGYLTTEDFEKSSIYPIIKYFFEIVYDPSK